MLTNCVISVWGFTKLFNCTHMFRFLYFESFLTRNSSYGFTRSSSFMQLAHGSLSCSLNFFNENKNLEMRIFLLFSFSRKWKLAQHLSCDLNSTVPRTHSKAMWLFFVFYFTRKISWLENITEKSNTLRARNWHFSLIECNLNYFMDI